MLLVVWGNVASVLVTSLLPGGDWAAVAWGAALVAASVCAARALGLRPADLGIVRPGPRRIAAGAALGCAAGGVGVAVLRAGPLLGAPIAYEPLSAARDLDLAAHILFFLPLAVVIPEELAFRGVLLGGLRLPAHETSARVWSSVAFSLWHVSVVYATLMRTNLADTPFAPVAGVAALIFVFTGGLVLAELRGRASTLAAPVAAHWAFDAALLAGLRP